MTVRNAFPSRDLVPSLLGHAYAQIILKSLRFVSEPAASLFDFFYREYPSVPIFHLEHPLVLSPVFIFNTRKFLYFLDFARPRIASFKPDFRKTPASDSGNDVDYRL